MIPELEPAKLRRVAFCVDVEIAGGPQYKDEQTSSEKKRLAEDKKVKERSEGEALKDPERKIVEKESVDLEGVTQDRPAADDEESLDKKESSRKKEKKKRSEESRKERKEQKRREAECNGSVPLEISRETTEDDGRSSPESPPSIPRPLDRPTTDPLRIYRRCCQLRESPVLKRIADQLNAAASCALETPGVVMSLNLTGSRLQFADIVSLSDWLAVVPVKKLILEDSDLTDEGVRVILAGYWQQNIRIS